MKQILHIFSKDVRHLRIEIPLSIVLCALFAWVVPRSWPRSAMMQEDQFQLMSNLLHGLLPLIWALVIAQLIHGEVLVGDRQFWVTRPYEWPKLLAAKALFISVFIYVPFLLMEVAILLQAGFNPLFYIPGLCYRLFLISAIFFPLVALAAVTSNLVRMALTIVAVYVGFIGIMLPLTLRSHGDNGPMLYRRTSWEALAAVVVIVLVCSGTVVLQYARRRVLVARLVLGSTPILVWLAAATANSSMWMNRTYPTVAQTDPGIIQIIPFDQNEKRSSTTSFTTSTHGGYYNVDTRKWAVISVDLRGSGIVAGDRWLLDAFRPTLTPANGVPLKLGWQLGLESFEAPADSNSLYYHGLEFLIRRADYERLKTSPLRVHLDLALTQATPAWSQRFALPEGDFNIPGFAFCSTLEIGNREALSMTELVCHFPLRQPALTTVTTFKTPMPAVQPCEAEPTTTDKRMEADSTTWGNFDAAPASFGISPVEQASFFSSSRASSNDSEVWRLCPGTPVLVTQSGQSHEGHLRPRSCSL